jgi:hypothetical protein
MVMVGLVIIVREIGVMARRLIEAFCICKVYWNFLRIPLPVDKSSARRDHLESFWESAMRPFVKRHCLLLLLIVIISQVSLVVHAVDHRDSGHQVCQLCHARDDNATAISPNEINIAVVAESQPRPCTPFKILQAGFTAYFHARAPPLPI